MTDTKAIAAGIAGGYLLGRTKKAKLALTVASMIASRRLGISPRQLLADGVRKLSASPEFDRLKKQVSGELMVASRTLLSVAADRRLGSMADALQERSRALESPNNPAPDPACER